MTDRHLATVRAPTRRRALTLCCVAAALAMPAACSGDESARSAIGGDGGAATSGMRDQDRSPAGSSGGSGATAADGADDPDASDPDPTGSMDQPAHTTGTAEPTIVTTGGHLPHSFPKGIPLPDNYTVNMASESTADGARSFVAQLEAPGEPRAVFDLLTARFAESGWEELQKSTSNLGDSPSASATYSNGTILVNLGAIQGGTPGTVAITYSVVPAEA